MNRLDINSFVKNGFILDQLCRIKFTVTDFVTPGSAPVPPGASFPFSSNSPAGIRHAAQYRDIGDCDSRQVPIFTRVVLSV